MLKVVSVAAIALALGACTTVEREVIVVHSRPVVQQNIRVVVNPAPQVVVPQTAQPNNVTVNVPPTPPPVAPQKSFWWQWWINKGETEQLTSE